jgi:hypothetical protein
MCRCIRYGLILAGLGLFGLAAAEDLKALVAPGALKPSALLPQADVVVIGKVVEVDKEPVDATQYRGAPKDQKISYKVAVIKIDEAIVGGKGLTQFRVGFSADAPVTPTLGGGPVGGARIRPVGRAPVALTAGQEGCFFLTQHHEADFYVLTGGGLGAVLNKKDDNYAKQLEEVKKVVKVLEDPVAALKAKELDDRFQAAYMVLQKYQTVRGGQSGRVPAREPIPEEENKLIVSLLTELPWVPKEGATAKAAGDMLPSRSALWYMINPVELGFKQPKFPAQRPGDPPVDSNKIMDEATTKFLKESGEKIKIKRFAEK